MTISRQLGLAVLLLAAVAFACNNDNIHNSGSIDSNRFQGLANTTDTFLLDQATGDLWRLAENEDPPRWERYAEAPTDVKPVDLRQVLQGKGPVTPTP